MCRILSRFVSEPGLLLLLLLLSSLGLLIDAWQRAISMIQQGSCQACEFDQKWVLHWRQVIEVLLAITAQTDHLLFGIPERGRYTLSLAMLMLRAVCPKMPSYSSESGRLLKEPKNRTTSLNNIRNLQVLGRGRARGNRQSRGRAPGWCRRTAQRGWRHEALELIADLNSCARIFCVVCMSC